MKNIFLSLLFISASTVAQTRTPALEQYMRQLDCTTETAVDQMSLGVGQEAAIASAATTCLPEKFSPVQQGLPKDFAEPTREDRIASLSKSTSLRLDLCKRSNVNASACLKLFQPSN